MSIDKAQKRQQLINRANGKTDEPIISLDNGLLYERQLNHSLGWYAREAGNKERKQWVLSYYKKLKQTQVVDHLTDLPEYDFYSLGAIIRMKTIGCYLSDKEEQYIIDRTQELLSTQIKKATPAQVAKTATVVVGIQERILEKASEFAGNIDGQIDEFVMAGCPANFKIAMNGMTTPTAKYVTGVYSKQLAELQEVLLGEDEQLVEGYSNFSKVQLKRFIALLEQIIANCDQAKKLVVRKPRARKAKPAGEVVKRMKFMKEQPELGLKSISAPSIVGSVELWVYNVKTKRLQVYRAVAGELLTVKGTSILNYDTLSSFQKTIRKPEQVAGMAALGKRPLTAQFKSLTTKETLVNGRINEDCILLKVF
jgi:hypothetical protein